MRELIPPHKRTVELTFEIFTILSSFLLLLTALFVKLKIVVKNTKDMVENV